MAKSLKVGIGDLVAELLAHTLCVGGGFTAAGAIAVAAFQPFANDGDDFFIGV